MLASRMQRATPAGPRSTTTPSASSTSAEPHCDDAARFPCLATRAPAAAATSAAMVDTLTVPDRSPPEPHVSTSGPPSASTSTRSANSSMVRTSAASSLAVSPLARSVSANPAICASVASPPRMALIASRTSVGGRASLRRRRPSTSGQSSSLIGRMLPASMRLPGVSRVSSRRVRRYGGVVARAGDARAR